MPHIRSLPIAARDHAAPCSVHVSRSRSLSSLPRTPQGRQWGWGGSAVQAELSIAARAPERSPRVFHGPTTVLPTRSLRTGTASVQIAEELALFRDCGARQARCPRKEIARLGGLVLPASVSLRR